VKTGKSAASAVIVFTMYCAAAGAWSQTAEHGGNSQSPEWSLQGSFPDPTGRTMVDADGTVTVLPRTGRGGSPLVACKDDTAKYCGAQTGFGALGCLAKNENNLSEQCKPVVSSVLAGSGGVPPCSHSPVCDGHLGVGPKGRQDLQRVEWKQTLGYTHTYPYMLPQGIGGVPAVALDSKGDLWVFKRTPAGTPQLYEFGPGHKLIRTVGDDIIGHAYKAHGMAIDAHDNVWICDAALATVKEVSPEGKLLRTIGVQGQRGDWDEAKGQRLLWQPLMVAFGPKGDIYIGEGHGNESPNDTDSDDPANQSGAARVIHLDQNGRFLNQWYGDHVGQGKFSMVHGIAVDPANGDVWIGDREQYRIVVYTANGEFIKTIQLRNLVCALEFDAHGQLWMGSGQDGQFLKLDRNGKVVGAVGNGMGIGPGQFIEASYFVFDKQDNLYAGDTSVGRITEFVPARN
jgi:sugar lactone lactonase YvrE